MKVVVISDMHAWYSHLDTLEGDILIICGDIELYENISQVIHFKKWLDKQKFKHIIVIAGNHDRMISEANNLCRSILEGSCIYLENSGVTIEGIKFWGSPFTPRFGSWYFMKDRGDDISRIWDMIPADTDVLITHGPPMGILDEVKRAKGLGENAGCYDLMRAVNRIKPKFHMFGHIHEGYGILEKNGTTFINASLFNERFEFEHKPIVVEIKPQ